MAYLLALAAAAFYGAADFLGGLAARRTHTSAVIVISGLAGLALLAVLLPLIPARAPTARDLSWGAAAGVAGGVGLGLLYRALAVARMAVVAPTTAVCAVIIPAVAGIARGERFSLMTGGGIALALMAIVLVSQSPERDAHRSGADGLLLALGAGVAIGLFYLALAETSAEAGLWPLLASRATSSCLFVIAALVRRDSLLMDAPTARVVIGAGFLDMTANVLYVLATHGGALSTVVTLTSLYPASTVVLARVVLHERLSRVQATGVACALMAVVLIVRGG